MATDCLFREDSYLKSCEATVVAHHRRTAASCSTAPCSMPPPAASRPTRGTLITADGATHPDRQRRLHRPRQDRDRARAAPRARRPSTVGDTVQAAIDWDTRHARMRMHTALHLLSAVLPYPVTGGSVGDGEGRLDFDIPEAGLDKDAITAKLAEMIAADAAVTAAGSPTPSSKPIRAWSRPCR